MKILITAPNLSPLKNVSGISSVVTNIIQYNTQHTFHHYLLGKPDQSMNKVIYLFHLIWKILYFPIFLTKNKIELVHQNLPFGSKSIIREFIINCWCRIIGVPVMLHIHGGAYLKLETTHIFFTKLALSLLNNSKQVIVLSKFEQELLKDKFSFLTSKILPNSIDTVIYNSQKSKKFIDKPVLLYLGRIEENKGLYELIEALKLLKCEFDFRFILCGTGILTEYSIKEFSENLGNDFEFMGVVSGEDKLNIIKQSNIFLLPSYFEGLPMALLETMADGIVPIVTNVGSMTSIIKHGINGMFVEKQNYFDLYEKIKIILLDHELFTLMSKNAKNTIIENHDISNYIVQLNKIYNLAVNS